MTASTVVRAPIVWLAVLAWSVPAEATAAGAPSDWLDRLFPSVANCTPAEPIFYDEKSGTSVPGTLEARGYTARKVTPEMAEYQIDEHFHGLHATTIQIPNHMAVVAVTMDVPVNQAKARLEQAFSESVAVYPANDGRPGVAYLYAKPPRQTVFVCTSEPE